jgi:hypothetical protein
VASAISPARNRPSVPMNSNNPVSQAQSLARFILPPKEESCGGKKRSPVQRRRSGWVSGTSTITILNPSGSRICISRNPHGLSVGNSIISTPASSSSYPTASTSRTCNHTLTLSLVPVREEPDNSRKPPPRKKTTPLVDPLPYFIQSSCGFFTCLPRCLRRRPKRRCS